MAKKKNIPDGLPKEGEGEVNGTDSNSRGGIGGVFIEIDSSSWIDGECGVGGINIADRTDNAEDAFLYH